MPKILVMDDSRMMSLYLRRCLEKAGHQVVEWTPASAAEIAAMVANLAPDLVLTDYFMQGSNGATVTRMVKQAFPAMPMLVLTAFREPEMEATLLRLGVHHVLDKPIPEGLLNLAVAEALAEAAEEREEWKR